MTWAVIAAGVVYVAGFVWMGVALGAVLGKLGGRPAESWIPVKRHVAAARAGDVPTPPVWVARGVGAFGWIVFATIVVLRQADAVAGSGGIGALALVAFVLAVAGSAVGWVLWIVGASHIESRLVVETRLLWLAALVPPAWSSVIGFGSSRPAAAGRVAGTVEADDATRAIRRVVAPVPPPEPEPTPEPERIPEPEPTTQPVPAATPEPPPASGIEATTPSEAAMTIDDYDITGRVPRAFSPYDRAAAPATPEPAPSEASVWPFEDDDDDATFFAKRRRARWVLRVVDGEDYDLEDITTIGREGIRPVPGVLPIIDDTRTMSKLHARLRRESDNWFVTDLGSTNGTFVRDSAGNEVEVHAQTEAKIEGTLLLGDLEAIIVDQREGTS